jgi:hypothetical protein
MQEGKNICCLLHAFHPFLYTEENKWELKQCFLFAEDISIYVENLSE